MIRIDSLDIEFRFIDVAVAAVFVVPLLPVVALWKAVRR